MTDDDRRSWRPSPDEPLMSFAQANASFVTPYLAVGGDLDYRSRTLATDQVIELHRAGITHLIDVRVEWSDEDWVAELLPRLQYFHHGIDDAGQLVPPEWFQEGVDFALTGIDAGGVVLAHCHMGINRGPSLGFAILLALGWDAIDALDAIRAVRPIAFIAYAEDALRWHHQDDPAALRRDLGRLEMWRRDNDLDVENVIRLKREAGE
jgi:dual specificity phosphatase 3